MNIAVIQSDICWEDAAASRRGIDKLLARVVKPDVVVLPEMFATGFCMNPIRVAEPEGGDTLLWMKHWAVRLDCAVTGSVPTEDGGRFFNRMYFVYPDGSYRSYDKRHLFTFGGEDKVYTRGEERVVVEFRGFRFLLLVCYDLRFPVWSRCRKDYDVLINVANWPTARRDVWDALLRARALENQCYVAGVNRVGADDSCTYNGGSVILSPYGKVIASCEDDKSQCAQGEISLEELERFRRRFPVLDDADDFTPGY